MLFNIIDVSSIIVEKCQSQVIRFHMMPWDSQEQVDTLTENRVAACLRNRQRNRIGYCLMESATTLTELGTC